MSGVHDQYSVKNISYKVGQDNIQKWGFDIHNPVFAMSTGLILLFLAVALIGDAAVVKKTLDGLKWDIIATFDSFFIWSGNFFIVFCLVLLCSPWGKIRLGGAKATPEHSTLSWLAMLFAAGMGIGLMFWGVAEPVAYLTGWYKTPLGVEANTPEAAQLALGATLFHWGIHPWAIYAVVALSLAFFTYNKGLPLSIRSIFFPILGNKTWGWPGHIVDILAVLATLFGLATSLGLGAQQAAAGINYVFGVNAGIELQLLIIVVVTALAIVSVVRGLEGGVKLLSNINMLLAFGLLLVVIFSAFSVFLHYFPTTIAAYVKNILPLSNPHGRTDEAWLQGWTVFYWAWWVSWSPFVGMFIARLSRGRSIREFIVAVLLVPTSVTALWMSAYGGIAIDQIFNKVGELGNKGLTEVPLAMFQMFDALPMSDLLSVVAIVLILVFFVTSSDSGSLVIDSITAGGKINAPVPQRIYWATAEGAIAATLLWVGGTEAMQALQAGTISTGLPFTFVLLIMCISLLMGLKSESKTIKAKA